MQSLLCSLPLVQPAMPDSDYGRTRWPSLVAMPGEMRCLWHYELLSVLSSA